MKRDWQDFKKEFEEKSIDPTEGHIKIDGFKRDIEDAEVTISHAEYEIEKIEQGMNFSEIIDELDKDGDISVEEWVAIGYSLGYFAAHHGHEAR